MPTYFQGDSFAINISIPSQSEVTTSDFDIDVTISQIVYKTMICGSTTPVEGELPIGVRSTTTWFLNIPAIQSTRLQAGNYAILVKYTHKATHASHSEEIGHVNIRSRPKCTHHHDFVEIDPTTPLPIIEFNADMSFATRIGLDGHTPIIGDNGNWWIAGRDTGKPAGGIKYYNSNKEFPNIGNANIVFVDNEYNRMYRWSDVDLKYYIVGSDYNEIKIINGGDA